MTPLATISADNFQAIQSALPAFLQNGLNLAGYHISVFEREKNFIVIFAKSGLPSGFRGSPEGFPGFEVELNKSDLAIVRANFVR